MDFPFFNGRRKKREQTVVIDLGSRTTKAIHVQRKGDTYNLLNFAVIDAPIYDKAPSPELLSDHLKAVNQAMGSRVKNVVLVVGDAVLRHAEVPMAARDDMRLLVKFNTKAYLQQDLPDHTFDCHLLPFKNVDASGKPAEQLKPNQKVRALVGGAKNQLINDLQSAARLSGLVADAITPSLIGPANAFELAHPEIFSKETVALVDIGFKTSSITILLGGELMLNRVVAIGGDKLTHGLAQSMNITYAEAEGIKVGMPDEVKSALQALVSPLGRELRASLDFFEHQHDKTVSQVFLSGGSVRSEFIVQTLQEELMTPCKTWNPMSFLTPVLPHQRMGEFEQAAQHLTVAAGAAAAAL